MAKYTVELNEVVKSGYNIFDFSYDFYDESKRKAFETKFINHFFFREIGCETVARFKKNLENTFIEKFPYYNMLFQTALIAYEKTINYNLSETFTKDNNKVNALTGVSNTNGSTNDTSNSDSTTNKTTELLLSGEKSNYVDTETDINNKMTDDKVHTIAIKDTINKTLTDTTTNKKVGSDTPNGLLSMPDILTNVYASKADIENGLNTNVEVGEVLNTNLETNIQTTDNVTGEKVSSTIKEDSTNTQDEDTRQTSTGELRNNGSFDNENTTSQNTTATETENYTKILKGSFGVITEADMLQKHINLQKVLTTIYTQFFDECEDLFMGIY